MIQQDLRLSARISTPYPIRLRKLENTGPSFKEETILRNLSGGGLYVRLEREMEVGAYVSLAVRLSTVLEGPALRLVARGNVIRVEPQTDGTFGTAIEFRRRRIL
jgi:hypothetical protein